MVRTITFCTANVNKSGGGKSFEEQHAVVAAKAEGIVHGDVDCCFAGRVGDVVKITFGIGRFVVDGGRQHLVL